MPVCMAGYRKGRMYRVSLYVWIQYMKDVLLTLVCTKTIVQTILISTRPSWKNINENNSTNIMGISSVSIYIPGKICSQNP